MTKAELWAAIVCRNPKCETEPVTFQPATFRAFFDQVWDMAARAAPAEREPWASGDMPDFMRDMMGGAK